MDVRLPAHLEISALLRLAQEAGGFGTVLKRGENDAGTILLVTMEKGANASLWERMPQLDGSRRFALSRLKIPENKQEFPEYLARRGAQDPDTWIVELDIPDSQRFVANLLR